MNWKSPRNIFVFLLDEINASELLNIFAFITNELSYDNNMTIDCYDILYILFINLSIYISIKKYYLL